MFTKYILFDLCYHFFMRLTNPKIYVIDDDPLYLQLLVKSLNNNDYKRVVGFNSATEGLNKIDSPDIIFIDYHLGDLNGLSTSKILKQTWKQTKIILISNEFSLNKINNPKKYGIDFICAKSSNFNQFSIQIKQIQFRLIVSIVLKITALFLILIAVCSLLLY